MFSFFKKRIPFVATFRESIIIGLVLGLLLSFIIIFLEPYNTNQFQHKYKTLLLFGFGIVFFLTYITYSRLENLLYKRIGYWNFTLEIISILTFYIIVGSSLFLYNNNIVNGDTYSLKTHWIYFKQIVINFIPIFSPFLLFLRFRLGKIKPKNSEKTITIYGKNQDEKLKLLKDNLLFIKANENYIDITFLNLENKLQVKTFRHTLSKIHSHISFLEKCHRSYLVNTKLINEVRGNSQNAKIILKNSDLDIPLSKTYYNKIISKINLTKD